MRLDFEGDAVYLHKEDDDNLLSKNGLWLDMSDALETGDSEWVFARTILSWKGFSIPTITDNMGLFSGAIESVTRLDRSSGAAIRGAHTVQDDSELGS